MLPSHKFGITGGCIVVLSVIVGFIMFDQILRFGIRDQTALRKRNEIRGIYLKLPIPLDFRVYFFNISNPVEVQNGEIPDLKQVGPYCYDEFKEKIDVVDNDGEDSLTYTPYDIYQFNQNRSDTLTEDDYVTVLHPLLVGMVNKVTKDTPAYLSILNQAIPLIFPNIQSIYLTAKVKDILFDGVEIDCRAPDFPAKAVCSQLKGQIPGLKMSEKNNVYLFSILGTRNATAGKRFKIKRGISNSMDLGRVLEVDGQRELTIWGGKPCNVLKGTDGWIFPPFLTPEEGIWSVTDICRSIKAEFVRDVVFKGVNVRLYQANLGDMEQNEEEKCFCDTPKTCLKKGVFDLTKCMGVPIYVTLPHFLETDEIYLQQVRGMNPVAENHSIRIHFEYMTGTPIEAKKRIQFNFPISPNKKITIMQNIPQALHPLFWIEEGVELEGALLKKVTNVFLIIDVEKFIRWLGVLIGLILMAYGVHLHFKNKKKGKITPVHTVETVSGQQEERSIVARRFNNMIQNEGGDRETGKSVLSGHEFNKY